MIHLVIGNGSTYSYITRPSTSTTGSSLISNRSASIPTNVPRVRVRISGVETYSMNYARGVSGLSTNGLVNIN